LLKEEIKSLEIDIMLTKNRNLFTNASNICLHLKFKAQSHC